MCCGVLVRVSSNKKKFFLAELVFVIKKRCHICFFDANFYCTFVLNSNKKNLYIKIFYKINALENGTYNVIIKSIFYNPIIDIASFFLMLKYHY